MLQFLIKFTVLVLLANDIKSNLFKNLEQNSPIYCPWMDSSHTKNENYVI